MPRPLDAEPRSDNDTDDATDGRNETGRGRSTGPSRLGRVALEMLFARLAKPRGRGQGGCEGTSEAGAQQKNK